MSTKEPDLATVMTSYRKLEIKMQDCADALKQNAAILLSLSNGTLADSVAKVVNWRERAILDALYSFTKLETPVVPRAWLAVATRTVYPSGAYTAALANMIKSGFIVKAGPGLVTLEPSKIPAIAASATITITSRTDLISRAGSSLDPLKADIVAALGENPDDWMEKKALAEKLKQNSDGSAFRERLRSLANLGLIDFAPDAARRGTQIRLTLQWFLNGGK